MSDAGPSPGAARGATHAGPRGGGPIDRFDQRLIGPTDLPAAELLDAEEIDAEDDPLDMSISESAATTLTAAQLDGRLARLGAPPASAGRLAAVLPWAVSIAVHLGLLAIAVVVTWAVVRFDRPPEAVLVIADFERPHHDPLADPEAGSGVAAAAPALAPLPEMALDLLGAMPEDAESVVAELRPGSVPNAAVDWTPPTGRDAGFAGLRASNVRRVAYVVDATGSMVGALPIIVGELERSLHALAADQLFAVIFFQGNQATAVPPADRLVQATDANVERAIRWIRQRVVPAGRSDPTAALDAALRLRPDVIFLLGMGVTGSGEFEIAQSELLARLDRLNPADASGRRRTAIHCVQFLDPDPLDTLRRIAEIHGGASAWRFIGRSELGIAPK
ncbi:MAG TPA: hypothetical protein PKC43_00975 [Phycisphaerales bacterium]|nr:hypothetical protein [Phycisphaerales bacterium]HMP35999.1 hypothetical protein [Phycisphaerales bacterium]